LNERLATLRQPSLLIVDEIGYLPVTSNGANLFFQLVNARYERNSTVLTSNKSFKEWGDIFGDSVVAGDHRLVQGGAPLDNLSIHRHLLPGPDTHDVSDLNSFYRNIYLLAVPHHPGGL